MMEENSRVRMLYTKMTSSIEQYVNSGSSQLEAARSAFSELCANFSPPIDARISPTVMGGVDVLECSVSDSNHGYVVYFHGGGYTMGSAADYSAHGALLSQTSGTRVIVVDYRLRPEYPHPAAICDGMRVFKDLISNGVDASEVAFAGDSAGGGLAISTVLALKKEKSPLPKALVLFSPFLDLSQKPSAVGGPPAYDPTYSKHIVDLRDLVIGNADPRDPLISPIYGNFEGFPPVLTFVGTQEYLKKDGIDFVEKAIVAGVDATLIIAEGMYHIYPIFASLLSEGRRAVERAGEFLEGLLRELP